MDVIDPDQTVDALADPAASGTTFVPGSLVHEGGFSWRRLPAVVLRGVRPVARWLARLRWRQRVMLFASVTFVSASGWIFFGPASLSGQPPLQNAFLIAQDGKTVIAELSPEENRVVVPASDIPKIVQDAFVAAEDERFWSHPGVDPLAIVRAAWHDVNGGREGASTITQQYVKNTFVGGSRSFGRKMREAILAVRIDRRYSKKEILTAYLNSIYLGEGAYGVEAASRLYFGVPVKELKHPSQAALLAGLTSAPSRYSPRVNLAGATVKRDHVLDRMRGLRMITPEQAEAGKRTPIRLAPRKARVVRAPGFVDWVRAELLREVGEDQLYRGGLRVQTSLDLDVQRAAERAIAETLGRPGDPEAAVVTLDLTTGEVVAMVGGRGKKLGDLNLATQGRRQTGSAFKPFVLTAALMKGKELSDRYPAPSSTTIRMNGIRWPVRNYDRRGYGSLSLRRATAYSVNTVYAQLMRDVGIAAVVDACKRLGVTSPLKPVPSLALGTSGITVLEMASAYGAFSDSGLWIKPTGLHEVTSGDRALFTGPRQRSLVIPIDVADKVKEALGAVTDYGTGSRVHLDGFTAYGKTGTTEEHSDAWFVGFAGRYATAVWVGYPNTNKPMKNVHGIKVTGGSFPATIWMRTMSKALEKDTRPFVWKNRGGGQSPSSRGPASQSPAASPFESTEPSPQPSPSRRGIPIPIPSLP